ncbi:MAG: hypothetical protein JW891_17635 [Candidatus Lokiarchaeota archaeon]|nr:hypothetical protein [Candidatus Lokiarchaeota archaeon]
MLFIIGIVCLGIKIVVRLIYGDSNEIGEFLLILIVYILITATLLIFFGIQVWEGSPQVGMTLVIFGVIIIVIIILIFFWSVLGRMWRF